MLVLKDGVTLRELKKYGFTNSDDNTQWIFWVNPWHFIWIDKETKIVTVFDDEDLGQYAADVLYDLIKDGLIRKEK